MSVKNLTRVVSGNISRNLTSATMAARSLLSARCGTRAGGREATLPWLSPAHTNWQGRVVEIGEKKTFTPHCRQAYLGNSQERNFQKSARKALHISYT